MPISKRLAQKYVALHRQATLEAVAAAANREPPRRVPIVYAKKTTGETVDREIRPYEVKSLKNGRLALYATDTLHGAGQIHSFLVANIRSVGAPDGRFKPRWPVQFGME